MSGTIRAQSGAREMTISAVITRADGRIEDLGPIAYFHKNPFKRLAWRVGRLIRRLRGL